MTDWELVRALASALEMPALPDRWAGLDSLLPLIERMQKDGVTFLLKLDGGRQLDPYTAVVNGIGLGDWFVRRDDESLEGAVTFVLARLYEHRRTLQ